MNFFIEYLKHPSKIGAVAPSSRNLAKKMTAPIHFEKCDCIIEYGPGTGAFTEEIIKRKKKETLFLVIEQNKEFYETLKEKYKEEENVILIYGDAAKEESKNRLIADISHDLRTPLTSIMGYVDLVKENEFRDKDKCNQYMEVVDRRLHNMKSLIDQLFEFTKLNQKDLKLQKEETNLIPLLQYIDFEYGSIFKRMGYQWSMRMNADFIPVRLDVEKFMRAMGNLLENARKYSKPNTENIQHLFERFYKADESRNSNTSTGLGLPIVKKIIELHDGTIEAKLEDKRICFQIVIDNKED